MVRTCPGLTTEILVPCAQECRLLELLPVSLLRDGKQMGGGGMQARAICTTEEEQLSYMNYTTPVSAISHSQRLECVCACTCVPVRVPGSCTRLLLGPGRGLGAQL